METSNNENVKAECKAKPWMVQPVPQTRLQKQAPAALQLDQMVVDGETENPYYCARSNEAPSCCAIPLLSPLVLSPMHSREGEEEEQLVIPSARSSSGNVVDDETTITPPQSPDSDAFPEASSLFSFFQAQCTLVNRVQ
ncbi:hypothetical protein RHSIM_Rhsim13G0077200 [Rhododendron simsii]|uniref:Uncharacterized protein n=1 Tax=Rhododendron simsii TaxID=118357 RepID=A0A834G2Q5_RHOSS|nr:hypothetical protein RHSIM_Rhsim13G0077200 [Rhododendron simsii]